MHPRILIISHHWDCSNPTRYLLHQELVETYGAILSGWNYPANPNDKKYSNGAVDVVFADSWVLSDTVSPHYTDIKPTRQSRARVSQFA